MGPCQCYLFGPMPDTKHILVVQDMFTRFPAAKIVNSTSVDPVIKALDDIYTNLGTPITNRANNGSSFNSQQFKEHSDAKGILHNKVYLYHPQANPVETFMKPLGKAMKIAHHKNQNKETTLDQLLASYQATPHITTSLAPVNLIFQHGYKHDFPLAKPPIANNISEAHAKHLEQQQKRKHKLNASRHSKTSDIEPGQLVLAKNFKHTKFHPYYGPQPYKVLSKLSNSGVVLQGTNDNQIIQQHVNNTKPIHQQHAQLTPITVPTPTTYIWDNPASSVNHQAVNTNNDSPAVIVQLTMLHNQPVQVQTLSTTLLEI